MTINQYKCEDCKAQFELLEGNATEVKCLGCDSKNVKKEDSRKFDGGCDCSSCPGCHH